MEGFKRRGSKVSHLGLTFEDGTLRGKVLVRAAGARDCWDERWDGPVLETREAMLYYALQRLGLSRDEELRPVAQQISLKNKAEVHAVIERLSKSYD